MKRRAERTKPQAIRCAIYTRKSTDEGLDQDFNSLDAQRESAEAFIASMKHEGWVCLPERYDDGGFTGGNMDRPALKGLLADIEAGKIDCVVVYKVDRLSRSLLDFSRMMETFDKYRVSFVSVTQQFNTTHSMGRLTLNILLSFAQFEREIISERTRDKMSAARRKGKYVGGAPIFGYDVLSTRLVVNPDEAERVRQVFRLYLERESLLATVAELDRRGWRTKEWTTKKGRTRGGRPFDKMSLYKLLTNIAYTGKVRYREELLEGEHEAIVPDDLFQRVQALLRRNHRTGGAAVRNKSGALLRGILRCSACGCAMGHSHARKGNRRYRYYVCLNAQKRGWKHCPAPSIPAEEIERFVVDQIRAIGNDPGLAAETLEAAQNQQRERALALEQERRVIERDRARAGAGIRKLAAELGVAPVNGRTTARLAELNEQVRRHEQRLAEIDDECRQLAGTRLDGSEVADALRAFDPVWDSLTPRERARIIELLVERVDYDGRNSTITVTFRPAGIQSLSEELLRKEEHAA